MIQITAKVQGMQCGMCESHINDVVRRNFKVKKVSSSRSKGETVILAENEIDGQELKRVIEETGYTVGEVSSKTYEKKGIFGFLK